MSFALSFYTISVNFSALSPSVFEQHYLPPGCFQKFPGKIIDILRC